MSQASAADHGSVRSAVKKGTRNELSNLKWKTNCYGLFFKLPGGSESRTKICFNTPSMSRRGNCYDNAMAENFFGILKAECLRRHKPKTIEQAKMLIDNFIYFYNHERIQLKTKLTPLEKRRQLV